MVGIGDFLLSDFEVLCKVLVTLKPYLLDKWGFQSVVPGCANVWTEEPHETRAEICLGKGVNEIRSAQMWTPQICGVLMHLYGLNPAWEFR